MKTIVFVGDSITEGSGDDRAGGWTRRLAAHLPQDWQAVHAGVGGNTIADILARLDRDVLAYSPAIVVLAVGINDSHTYPLQNHRPELPMPRFCAGLERFARRVNEANAKVLVVGLAPVDEARTAPLDVDLEYTNARAQAYDEALQEFSRQHGYTYVALWQIFQANGGPQALTMDGLHPNPEGHALIAEQVMAALAPDL